MKTSRALFCALPLFCAVTFAQTDTPQTTSPPETTSTSSTTTTQTKTTVTPVQIQKWQGTLVDAACMSGGATSMAAPSVTTTTTTTSTSSSTTPAAESSTVSANPPNPTTASDRDHPSVDQNARADNQITTTTETTATTTDASNKGHHKEHRSRMNDSSSRQNCPVSTSTTTFGLKLNDGTLLKFDSVGNTRAASELSGKQTKWSKDLGENKPIRAKVNGIPNGDTIVVTDIH